MKTLSPLFVALLALPLPVTVLAQTYPGKPIRIVSQFAGGSGGDTVMRLVTTYLAPLLAQPLINDNRPGAGGVLAAQTVSGAVADGYTLLSATTGGHIARVHLVKGAPFDLVKDLTPIIGIADTPILLVGHPSVPANSAQALIEYAKANPGKLSYGTSGIGSTSHLTAEQLKMLTGAAMVHVPYKAGAQALTDVVSGQLPLSYTILTSVLPYIQSGKLKAFATTNGGRAAELPAVPFIEELVPGFNALQSWLALFGPPNLPEPIARRLNADTARAVNLPEAKARIGEAGFVIVGGSPEQFVASISGRLRLSGGSSRQPTSSPRIEGIGQIDGGKRVGQGSAENKAY